MQALPASLVLRAVLQALRAWLLCWQMGWALGALMRWDLGAWPVRILAGQACEVQVQKMQGLQGVLQLGLVGLWRGAVGVGGMRALGAAGISPGSWQDSSLCSVELAGGSCCARILSGWWGLTLGGPVRGLVACHTSVL